MAKSPNTSIRYDIEKVDLVKSNENIDTIQKVFNFLLDKYWWEKKLPKDYSNKVEDFDKFTTVDRLALRNVEPITNKPIYQYPLEEKDMIKSVPINQLAAWTEEILATKTISSIEYLMSLAKADKILTPQEKFKLEQIAKEHSKDFYND